MEILIKLDNYIKNAIKSSAERLKPLEEIMELIKTADFILNNIDFIIESNYDLNQINNINQLFEKIHEANPKITKEAFFERIDFLKKPRNEEIFDSDIVSDVQTELDNILSDIKKLRDTNEVKNYKNYNSLKRTSLYFKNFEGIIENGKIAKSMDLEEYEEISNFIKDTNLDPEEKFQLIEIFSIHAIESQEKKRKIELNKSKVEVSKNVKRIEKDIASTTKIKEPKEPESKKELSPEEKKLVEKIRNLMDEFKTKGINPSEASALLLNDDFDIEIRKMVYYSNDNVLEAVYGDLQYNLYPNISSGKLKDMLKLFKYIVEVYEKETTKTVQRNISLDALTEEEYTELDDVYDNISEEIQTLEEKESLTDEEKEALQVYKKFVSQYSEYKYLIQNIQEIFANLPESEIIAYVKDDASKLIATKDKALEISKILDKPEVIDSPKEEQLDYSDELGINTWIVHLTNLKNNELYSKEDSEKVIKENKKFSNNIATAFKKMYSQDSNTRHNNTRKILNHDSNVPDNTAEFRPRRLKSGSMRIGYCDISIGEKNRSILAKAMDANESKFNVVLVLGVFSKRTSDNILYEVINKRIEKNYNQIKEIQAIFNQDLSIPENLEIAINLINDGFGFYNDVVNTYYKTKKEEEIV